jgi:hypothetical protein
MEALRSAFYRGAGSISPAQGERQKGSNFVTYDRDGGGEGFGEERDTSFVHFGQ